jgi:hypothetical protein
MAEDNDEALQLFVEMMVSKSSAGRKHIPKDWVTRCGPKPSLLVRAFTCPWLLEAPPFL